MRGGGVRPEDKDGVDRGVIGEGEDETAEEREAAWRVAGDEDGEAVWNEG